MQTFDGHSSRLAISIVLLLTMGFFSACDDSPITGGNLSPDDVMVNADTILLDGFTQTHSPAFSGNHKFFTAGVFDDPVFGKLQAAALVKPSLLNEDEADSLGNDENASGWLTLNATDIYGQTSVPSDFNVVEIERRWRSSSWRYDSIPDLSGNVIGQFTLADADSISIPLEDHWVQRYLEFSFLEPGAARDSLYLNQLPGLAIVPANTDGKIFSVEASRAKLVLESTNGQVALGKNMSRWAVTLESDQQHDDLKGTSIPVFNTLRSIIQMEIEFTEELLQTKNFSRVELVIYDDTIQMDTDVVPTYTRPRSETMYIYRLDPEQIPYAITSEPSFQSNRHEKDGSYRFNMTSLAHEQLFESTDSRKLYVTIGSNDGRIIPMLVGGPEDNRRHPRLLITSISQEQ